MLKLKRKYKAPLLSIFGACSILGSSTAFGAFDCSNSTGEIMHIDVSGDTVSITRESTAADSPILVNGLTCGDPIATVDNINAIEIHTLGIDDLFFPDLNENVVIDLANGPFAPGAGTETTSLPEIEFRIDLGVGTNMVSVLGGSSAETFDIGTANTAGNTGENQNYDNTIFGSFPPLPDVAEGDILVNTNAGVDLVDNDADIHIANPATTQLLVKGRDGADFLDGRAFPGTGVGSRPQVPLQLFGGPGADTIEGGPLNDTIHGNKGGDFLNGRGGDDLVKGGPGADEVFGGSGDDILFGQKDNDRLNGGAGFDECNVGTPGISSGDSAAVSCETVN